MTSHAGGIWRRVPDILLASASLYTLLGKSRGTARRSISVIDDYLVQQTQKSSYRYLIRSKSRKSHISDLLVRISHLRLNEKYGIRAGRL
jgi:hypothetical protein